MKKSIKEGTVKTKTLTGGIISKDGGVVEIVKSKLTRTVPADDLTVFFPLLKGKVETLGGRNGTRQVVGADALRECCRDKSIINNVLLQVAAFVKNDPEAEKGVPKNVIKAIDKLVDQVKKDLQV